MQLSLAECGSRFVLFFFLLLFFFFFFLSCCCWRCRCVFPCCALWQPRTSQLFHLALIAHLLMGNCKRVEKPDETNDRFLVGLLFMFSIVRRHCPDMMNMVYPSLRTHCVCLSFLGVIGCQSNTGSLFGVHRKPFHWMRLNVVGCGCRRHCQRVEYSVAGWNGTNIMLW